MLLVAAALPQPAIAAKKKRVTPAVQRHTAFDAGVINNSKTHPILSPGSRGSAVLRAQILLDRARFSPGEIDGAFGNDLRVAVAGFRESLGLKGTPRIDSAVWAALSKDTEPALVTYTISESDVTGPFEPIPAGMAEQAKLKSLGFQSVQEELGERFHTSPKLLAELNKGHDLTKAGEEIQVPNVHKETHGEAQKVVVSKADRTVTALDASGTILARFPATIGSEHDPLPIGDWKVTVVQHNPVFNYNPDLFWDAKPEDVKARIPAGPNNPVGVVWIGLSKEHYGIHGTPEPGLIGHAQSHGCIRLTNWDAAELARMVRRGTPVLLQE